MRGIRRVSILAIALAIGRADAAPPAPQHWTRDDIWQLADAIVEAAGDGLRMQNYDLAELGLGNEDSVADAAAKSLAHDLWEGEAKPADRSSWHIARAPFDYDGWLSDAVNGHHVLASVRTLRPTAPAYQALRQAWIACSSPAQCDTLKVNLDRWRRLPRDLGDRYLWVNAAAFRLDLVDHGIAVATRKVIVGKPGTPTPVFRAFVTGVTANPWWNVPCAIGDKEIARMVRDRPVEAARRGYVRTVGPGGRVQYRQRPGPENALGQVKLEMPNPFSVYLHDTPNRDLFERDERAFSHGCVRTEDPVSLGEQLLGPDGARALETALTTGDSKTISLPAPIPVYVVYLTAEPDGRGGVTYYDDIYHRDGR